MKKIVITILVCALVLFGASFSLQGVAVTTAQEQHLWLMRTLLCDENAAFTREAYTGEDANIVSVHKSDAGYVIETKTYGYADYMTMLVGVNFDGKVTGLVVREAHETWGLGSKVLTDHVFLSQFLNKSGTFTIGTASGEDAFSGATAQAADAGAEVWVDGISGATVSSKAVARSVTSAVAYVTGADAVSAATEWGG